MLGARGTRWLAVFDVNEFITHCVSTLFRYKAIVKVAKIKQQPEMEGLKDQLGDHFISVLAFICLALLSGREDRVKRSYCEYIFDLIMIKPSFNLTLLAFSVMACPHFNKVYCTKNTFYHPIVLQCAMKVDYLYNEMCQSDFTTLSIEHEKIDQYPGNSSKNTITKNRTSINFYLFFSRPFSGEI